MSIQTPPSPAIVEMGLTNPIVQLGLEVYHHHPDLPYVDVLEFMVLSLGVLVHSYEVAVTECLHKSTAPLFIIKEEE